MLLGRVPPRPRRGGRHSKTPPRSARRAYPCPVRGVSVRAKPRLPGSGPRRSAKFPKRISMRPKCCAVLGFLQCPQSRAADACNQSWSAHGPMNGPPGGAKNAQRAPGRHAIPGRHRTDMTATIAWGRNNAKCSLVGQSLPRHGIRAALGRDDAMPACGPSPIALPADRPSLIRQWRT